MASSEHLEALRQIVPNLPELVAEHKADVIEYKVPNGTCLGIGLFKPSSGEIAVQRSFLSMGTVLDVHQHEGKHETLVLYRGEAQVEMGGVTIDLKIGQPLYSPPGISHNLIAVTDCWVIGITTPASSGYPEDVNG
jgi:quercetin dioxygenase-like cupin family protein